MFFSVGALAAVPGHHQDLGALRSESSTSWSQIVSGPCLRPGLSQVGDCLRPVFRSVGDKPSTPEGYREACMVLAQLLLKGQEAK